MKVIHEITHRGFRVVFSIELLIKLNKVMILTLNFLHQLDLDLKASVVFAEGLGESFDSVILK